MFCLVLALYGFADYIIRLSGPFFSFKNHPVLAPIFVVDTLYLDSLVKVSG